MCGYYSTVHVSAGLVQFIAPDNLYFAPLLIGSNAASLLGARARDQDAQHAWAESETARLLDEL